MTRSTTYSGIFPHLVCQEWSPAPAPGSTPPPLAPAEGTDPEQEVNRCEQKIHFVKYYVTTKLATIQFLLHFQGKISILQQNKKI